MRISPPWHQLSLDASKLLVPECLLDGIRFGTSPEKTSTANRNALLTHWFRGTKYLEFHQRVSRGGKFSPPVPETDRWHALAKYDDRLTEQWLSNERTARGVRSPSARIPGDVSIKFGSHGPRPTLPTNSPYRPETETETEQDAVVLRRLPDPSDGSRPIPSYQPGRPSWPAPCLAPDTVYGRLQWSHQLLSETGGKAAATLLEGITWLAQLPVSIGLETLYALIEPA